MRRRLVWIGTILVLIAVSAATLGGREEATGSVYAGLATSEWEREITRWEVSDPPCGTGGFTLWVWRKPSAFAKTCEYFRIPCAKDNATLPLMAGDPDALPVLLDLFHSPNPNARRIAIEGVRRIGDQGAITLQMLRAALQDSDSHVSCDAARCLMKWDRALVLR